MGAQPPLVLLPVMVSIQAPTNVRMISSGTVVLNLAFLCLLMR